MGPNLQFPKTTLTGKISPKTYKITELNNQYVKYKRWLYNFISPPSLTMNISQITNICLNKTYFFATYNCYIMYVGFGLITN